MEAGFLLLGDLLVPSQAAAGPWSDQMVGGRHVAGLCAWAVERELGADQDLRVSRMTIDMFRPVPMGPLRVATRVARSGRRLQLLDVTVLHEDVEVARATALLLATSAHPEPPPWGPPENDMPDPEAMPTRYPMASASWEFRTAAPLGHGHPRAWIRERAPMVAGSGASPLVRALAASDFINPLVNSGEDGLHFINADLTTYLSRYPEGEWIGLDATGHVGADGIAVAAAWLCDEKGRFGHCQSTALADERIVRRRSAP